MARMRICQHVMDTAEGPFQSASLVPLSPLLPSHPPFTTHLYASAPRQVQSNVLMAQLVLRVPVL